jgi:hypothetical protein
MRRIGVVTLAAVLASLQAGSAEPASRVPFDDCTLTHHLASVYSLAALPAAVRSDVMTRVGRLADRGEPYQSTDAIVLHGAPMQRFIRAVQSEHKIFVWYEQGGIAVRLHVLVYDIGAVVPRFEAAFVAFDACAATYSYLNGKKPARMGQP